MKNWSLRLLALVALVCVASPAFAANFIVNSTAGGGDTSPGDGVCEHTSGAGDCTASAAVEESNAWPEDDAITPRPT